MNAQRLARIAGLLIVVSIVAGGLGEGYVPMKFIVPGDASATANNLIAQAPLFRLGFAAYLIEALCDTALAGILYALLRPVQREVSLIAALFGIISTATYAVCELFFFSAFQIVHTMPPAQGQTLALAMTRMFGWGGGVFLLFYGVATLLRGALVVRSRFLPQWLGVVMAIAGAGFVVKSFTLVLAPAYSSSFLLLPMFVAMIAMAVWFLWKGVDAEEWGRGLESPRHAWANPA